MSDVINGNFKTKYPVQSQMCDEIVEVMHKYSGQLSAASAVGVLEIVKTLIISAHIDAGKND